MRTSVRKGFESALKVSSRQLRSEEPACERLFLIRFESVSRVPSPGVVKLECGGRFPDMCRQGGSDVAGPKLGIGSVQQIHVCVSPNKALEPTVRSVTPRADARVAPALPVAHL